MTETPEKASSAPESPKPAPGLKPASMLRLSLGRPRLPIALSSTLAWLVFIFLAVVPVCLALGIVFYLGSSRWPADFSAQLSRNSGLHITVDRITRLAENRIELHDIRISARADQPTLLYAVNGTYVLGDIPTLSLNQVDLTIDLDWWADAKAVPDLGLFVGDAARTKSASLDLRNINLKLASAGHEHTLHADVGMASLSSGLFKLHVMNNPPRLPQPGAAVGPTKSPTYQDVLSASLGYPHGALVKQLTIKQAPADLLREQLGRALGKEWTAAFASLSGNLVLQLPRDGANWEFDGHGTFAPSLLDESSGLSGLGGKFDVRCKGISGAGDALLQGTFEISLIKELYVVPVCSVEALKAIQLMATGTTPLVSSVVETLPFDRAAAIITLNSHKVYVQAKGDDNAVMASGDVPILSFRPQVIACPEWTKRLLSLKKLWSQKRIS